METMTKVLVVIMFGTAFAGFIWAMSSKAQRFFKNWKRS